MEFIDIEAEVGDPDSSDSNGSNGNAKREREDEEEGGENEEEDIDLDQYDLNDEFLDKEPESESESHGPQRLTTPPLSPLRPRPESPKRAKTTENNNNSRASEELEYKMNLFNANRNRVRQLTSSPPVAVNLTDTVPQIDNMSSPPATPNSQTISLSPLNLSQASDIIDIDIDKPAPSSNITSFSLYNEEEFSQSSQQYSEILSNFQEMYKNSYMRDVPQDLHEKYENGVQPVNQDALQYYNYYREEGHRVVVNNSETCRIRGDATFIEVCEQIVIDYNITPLQDHLDLQHMRDDIMTRLNHFFWIYPGGVAVRVHDTMYTNPVCFKFELYNQRNFKHMLEAYTIQFVDLDHLTLIHQMENTNYRIGDKSIEVQVKLPKRKNPDWTKTSPANVPEYIYYAQRKTYSLGEFFLKVPSANRVQNLVFKPYPDYFSCAAQPRLHLNTWGGLLWSREEVSKYRDFETLRLVFNIIRYVIANDDNEYIQFLKRIATIVQKPWIKQGVSMVFAGEQGTFKSLLFELIIGILFGHNFAHIQNEKDITGEFTSNINSKVLIAIEECGLDERSGAMNVIKVLVTSAQERVRLMNKDPNNATSFTNLVFMVNRPEETLKITSDTRRFEFYNCSTTALLAQPYFYSIYKGNPKEIGADMVRDMTSDNFLGLKTLLNFFYNVDVEDFAFRTPLSTALGFRLKYNGLHPVLKWWTDNVMQRINKVTVNKDETVNPPKFYQTTEWCLELKVSELYITYMNYIEKTTGINAKQTIQDVGKIGRAREGKMDFPSFVAKLKEVLPPKHHIHYAKGEGQFSGILYLLGSSQEDLLRKTGKPISELKEISIEACHKGIENKLEGFIKYFVENNGRLAFEQLDALKWQRLRNNITDTILMDFIPKTPEFAFAHPDNNSPIYKTSKTVKPIDPIHSNHFITTRPEMDQFVRRRSTNHLVTEIAISRRNNAKAERLKAIHARDNARKEQQRIDDERAANEETLNQNNNRASGMEEFTTI